MKLLLKDLPFWFHDLGNCLHDCFGTLLLRQGFDPVEALGAGWEFHHDPAQVRGEEYYHPAPRPTLGENLFPFHPVRARWQEPADAQEAWAGIRASIQDGRPVLAAVDNFYMPIRPAFGDVHAAHLVVVWGFDDEAREVYLLEATPPLFSGPLAFDDFLRARGSANEARPNTRDYFFAGPRIRHRWIDVEFTGPAPEVTAAWVGEVVAHNVRGWLEPGDPGRGGLAGLRHWLADVAGRDDRAGALAELYSVGWAAQAAAALHADFLRATGNRLRCDALVHAGRQVDRLAHQWTGLRIFGAHGSTTGDRYAAELSRRTRLLLADHEDVLEQLTAAIRRLDEPSGDPRPLAAAGGRPPGAP
ncbi:BtrH N-terminal domain-containing protein [Micromonospora sp. NPDC048935]|uniref:BtrH N-terminal domain-containing protein n=1 Tax=Micromonospora sp. NPDC048935 TaxID=3364262 RepID=UPI00371B3DC1